MENNTLPVIPILSTDWYSEEFIYNQVARYLKENGYKLHKEPAIKEVNTSGKIITASKYFKKEIIEVKGFPHYNSNIPQVLPAKSTHFKSWFTEALFNSFVNFSSFENAEVAMRCQTSGDIRQS